MRYDVDISSNILKWVISNLNPNDTKPEILETLLSWENNTKTPTYNKVLDISRATGIPLGYFFLSTPPKENLSFVNYRTIDSLELSNPSRALKTTMLDMELIQDWMHNKLITDGETKNPYVNSLKGKENIDVIAAAIRKELNIKKDWYSKIKTKEDSFRFLRKAISNSGIIVMINSIVRNNSSKLLSIDEFRGFALIDDYAPLIFINSNDSINGRIFSLLHEYVHIGLGENSLYNDRSSCNFDVKVTETICNKVAAEILVPQEKFIEQWNLQKDDSDIEQIIDKLSKHFKCGKVVVARKALDNKFIPKKVYCDIAQTAVRNYKKPKSSGAPSYYRTLNSRIDPNFLTHLIDNVEKGKTLYTEAFRLTNTNRETFNKLKSYFEGELL